MKKLISSAWYGKQRYFLEDVDGIPDGVVYYRESGKYMTRDKAYIAFANQIGDDGEI